VEGIDQKIERDNSVFHYAGCQAAVVMFERFLATEEITHRLGTDLSRLASDDCCGGVEDPPNFFSGIVAPLRIIDLAAGNPLVTSCLSCLANMRGAFRRMEDNPETRRRAAFSMEIVGYQVPSSTNARHLLDLLAENNLANTIRERKIVDLDHLPVALYYGCRKQELESDTPRRVETAIETMGAKLVPFSSALQCCGGPKSYQRDVSLGKGPDILAAAQEAGASAVVTVCGMCQANLEKEEAAIPVIPFLQLLAVTLGMADPKVWLRPFHSVEGG
jgi:heterodisulfide reductase subunit B